MRAPISSKPLLDVGAGSARRRCPSGRCATAGCGRPPARRRSRRSRSPALSSAWSTSSGLARWARSVPSVNTTSVPKRSGTGARSICWVSRRIALDDGAVEVGRRIARPLRRQRGDAAADVAAEADHRGQVRAAVEAVDGHLLIGPDALAERRRRLDQRRHVARIDHAAAHVDQQQRVVNGRHLGLQDGLLALQDRDRLLVLVDLGSPAASGWRPAGRRACRP